MLLCSLAHHMIIYFVITITNIAITYCYVGSNTRDPIGSKLGNRLKILKMRNDH